ncbi:MAG: transglutaminase domain-containing protein [Candidatus Eisenbacteria bacterium]|nr:transglutaminase domain-containing protein [Candidatus Eisenbacteria bacterium]
MRTGSTALRAAAMPLAILAALAGNARAAIHDVEGDQYGVYEWRMTATRRLSGRYTSLRYPEPTVSYYGQHNYWALEQASLSVTRADGSPMQWTHYPYNQGEINSGAWIQPINPTPGIPFTYRVTLLVRDFAGLNASGVRREIALFGPRTVSYTYPTYPTIPGTSIAGAIDSYDSPVIDWVLDEALSNPAWATGVQPGRRGDLERIALKLGSVEYRSPEKLEGQTILASGVWLRRYGDCDDLVNLTCALHRRYGVPSRVLLTGSLDAPIPGMPFANPDALHAIGEYWNGDRWETCESHYFTNLAAASQVWLGADQDFANLYITPDNPVRDTLLAVDYSASVAILNSGSLGPRGDRLLDEPLELWAQVAHSQQPALAGAPRDSVGPPVGDVAVPQAVAAPPRLALRALDQPGRGRLAFALELPAPGAVAVELFDVSGRKREDVTRQFLPAGIHRIERVHPVLPPGIYYARASWAGAVAVAKLVYLGP